MHFLHSPLKCDIPHSFNCNGLYDKEIEIASSFLDFLICPTFLVTFFTLMNSDIIISITKPLEQYSKTYSLNLRLPNIIHRKYSYLMKPQKDNLFDTCAINFLNG